MGLRKSLQMMLSSKRQVALAARERQSCIELYRTCLGAFPDDAAIEESAVKNF
jgi:hypothetical protein